MFTQRRKMTHPPTDDELAELALSDHPKTKPIVVKSSGDEIEKISQDFQVAQLESLKTRPSGHLPIVPAAKVIRPRPPVTPRRVSNESSRDKLPREPESAPVPNSLLNILLSEIVEKDIAAQRERLTGKK
jgi:hypothetical protein